MKTLKQPAAQFALASMILGFGAVFVVFIDLNATVIAFYRLFIGALLFGFVLLYQKIPLAIAPLPLLFAVLAGVFLGIDLAMWNTGIQLIGPGIATILNSLQVFFMAVFGWLVYRDKPSIVLWLAVLVTLLGVTLLSSQEIRAAPTGFFGVMISIVSALAFAASMICLREAAKRQTSGLVNTMFYASVGGALATGIYAAIDGSSFVTQDAMSWLMIAIYGSVVHVFAWFLMAKSLPHVTVATAGLMMCLEPVTVFFIDLGFLDKSVTAGQAVGAVLTVTAIYVGSQAAKQPKRSK